MSRFPKEEIIVNTPSGDVRIVVTEVLGQKVRIGVDCDRSWPVNRLEVLQQKQAKEAKP